MAQSVINPDGKSIDISRLEREIKEDLSIYRQHTAEDGMKKRAIHTSKDYDEFKNFVSVSQLKPTSGREVSSLFAGSLGSVPRGFRNFAYHDRYVGNGQDIIGGYGDIIQRRKDAVPNIYERHQTKAKSSGGKVSRSCGLPNSSTNKAANLSNKSSRETYDFLRDWNQQCKTPEETISFLTRIEATNDVLDSNSKREFLLSPDDTCKRHFSTDIDSEILGDIIEGLHLLSEMHAGQNGDVSPNDHPSINNIKCAGSNVIRFVDAWLQSLARCGRFGLSVSFLTSKQDQKLKELFAFVKTPGTDLGLE
jgi:hypothetical protein